VLTPVADTTLISAFPSNNAGGMSFVNAGGTQNFTTNRGLFRFELAGSITPGARVTRVELLLEVVGVPKDGFAPAPFGLHRVLQPWGEGSGVADPGHPGQGVPSTSGEATWNDRFALTAQPWSLPGGAGSTDFVADASAEAMVYALEDSPYAFGPTPALIADVQSWLDRPDRNFGWMLICGTETMDFTARRFASREDANRAPLLRVEFTPPPVIDRAEVVGSSFVLQFTARPAQAYAVEACDRFALANGWLELTNVSASPGLRIITATDPLSPGQRFYRLRLP
jgi:hypothetical protein